MTLTTWQFLILFSSVVGSFGAIIKFLFDQFEKRILERLSTIEKAEAELRAKVERHSTEMLRREDWIRETMRTQATLDQMQMTLNDLAKQLVTSNRKG